MNQRLIRGWNARVKPKDIIFHLGDFCFRNSSGLKGEGVNKKADYWKEKLNGDIVILKGNHDKNNSLKSPITRLTLDYGGKIMLLTHDPVEFTKKDLREFDILLCGHVHTAWKMQGKKIVNVGVDVNNFMPISFNEILRIIKTKGQEMETKQ